MIADRLSDRLFTRAEAEKLAGLLNAAQLFHVTWRAVDLMCCSPRSLLATYERDPRVGTLRSLIEAASTKDWDN